jgi:hypothetical protein
MAHAIKFKRDGWTFKIATRHSGQVYVHCLAAEQGDYEEGYSEAASYSRAVATLGGVCEAASELNVTLKEICAANDAGDGREIA